MFSQIKILSGIIQNYNSGLKTNLSMHAHMSIPLEVSQNITFQSDSQVDNAGHELVNYLKSRIRVCITSVIIRTTTIILIRESIGNLSKTWYKIAGIICTVRVWYKGSLQEVNANMLILELHLRRINIFSYSPMSPFLLSTSERSTLAVIYRMYTCIKRQEDIYNIGIDRQ